MKKDHLLNWIENKFKTVFYQVVSKIITIIMVFFGIRSNTKPTFFLLLFCGSFVFIMYFLNKYKIIKYPFILGNIIGIFTMVTYIFFILNPTYP